MNNPENENLTAITPEDMAFIEEELGKDPRPISLHVLAEKLAFRKTAGQRSKDVKRYDPYARYEVGDFIYKDYDETLTVGSKNVEHFEGSVILKVIGRTFYKSFNTEMLEVDYDGGGVFRKYVDYMKKTRTQVLLPSNVEGRNAPPEVLDKASDPRLTELPMTERDLKILEKNLRTELGKVRGALRLERALAAPLPPDRHPRGQDQGDGGRVRGEPGPPPRPRTWSRRSSAWSRRATSSTSTA